MDCALWLNRKKILTAAEIEENLDIASLRGYLLAGTLIPWLEEHKGKRFVKRLEALKHDDPRLNEKIAEIFGGTITAPYKTLDGSTADHSAFGSASSFAMALSSFDIGSAGSYNYNAISSFGSYYGFLRAVTSGNFGSFELTGLLSSFSSGGSFTYGREWLWSFIQSYYGGSFITTSAGSFSYGWEWLWSFIHSYYGGSFVTTSGGSFTYGWEWLWNFIQSHFGGGSFTITSAGSFTYGWEWLMELFGGFGSFRGQFGSFGLGNFGSFNGINKDKLPELRLDEYDFILLKTLIDCPLDRFGYGIHNI